MIAQIGKLLWDTIRVTATVALGFQIHKMLGLPVWSLGFALLPAAYLFLYLSSDTMPDWWRPLAFLGTISLVTWCVTRLIFPQIPQQYHGIVGLLIIAFIPGRIFSLLRR